MSAKKDTQFQQPQNAIKDRRRVQVLKNAYLYGVNQLNMKKLISLAAIALAVCVAFASCTKEEEGGTVTVNGETYTNVTATVHTEHGGLWFQFILDKDKGITASALVDARLALEKTLKIGAEENNGGWGDWVLLSVEYGNGKVFGVQPGSGTQTIKKGKNAYTVKVDGKDQNGKPYKIDVTAKVE